MRMYSQNIHENGKIYDFKTFLGKDSMYMWYKIIFMYICMKYLMLLYMDFYQ